MKSLSLSIVFVLSSLPIIYGQWEDISINTDIRLLSIDFIDDDNGYVIGANQIFKTSDGGANWELNYEGELSMSLRDVFALDNETAFAVGEDKDSESSLLLRTGDNGMTWTQIPLANYSTLTSILFTSPQIGYCTAERGRILKTIDGGLTWENKSEGLIVTNNVFISVDFANDTFGIAVGDRVDPTGGSSFITKTENGGDSWELLFHYPDLDPRKISVFFSDEETFYLLESDGMFRIDSCGQNWTNTDPEFKFQNREIFFTDNSTGYVIGRRIQKTTNGGEDWEEITPVIQGKSPNCIVFNSIDFPSSEIGYIAGNDGAIFKTINGGISSTDDFITNSDIKIYPNPVIDILTLELKDETPLDYIEVYDSETYLTTIESGNSNQISLDLSNYPHGTYYLVIFSKNNQSVRRVLKY